ncbi:MULTISPECIES: hypothetical protein [Tsukamurella]|uniref:hypothetical protein n=1 Tax=Tsukamurella TaxID=2060 RepID=UPI001E315A08|nr:MULTISPECIES: hypothetical protein [Tsukamurella]
MEPVDGVIDHDEAAVAAPDLRVGAGCEESVVLGPEQAVRFDNLVSDLFDRLDCPRGLIDDGVVEPLLESGAVSHREVPSVSVTEFGSTDAGVPRSTVSGDARDRRPAQSASGASWFEQCGVHAPCWWETSRGRRNGRTAECPMARS